MKRLTEINAFFLALIYFGIIIISTLVFTLWISVVPEHFKLYGISIILIGSLGAYFHWLYIIGLGLDNIFPNKNKGKWSLKYNTWLIIEFLNISITIMAAIIYWVEIKKDVPFIINIISSIITIYSMYIIVVHLTIEFNHLDRGTEPKTNDFIITLIQLLFVPFGLMFLHSHMRLIAKKEKRMKSKLPPTMAIRHSQKRFQ